MNLRIYENVDLVVVGDKQFKIYLNPVDKNKLNRYEILVTSIKSIEINESKVIITRSSDTKKIEKEYIPPLYNELVETQYPDGWENVLTRKRKSFFGIGKESTEYVLTRDSYKFNEMVVENMEEYAKYDHIVVLEECK